MSRGKKKKLNKKKALSVVMTRLNCFNTMAPSGAYLYTLVLVQDDSGIWRFTSFAPTVDNNGIIVIS